MTEHAGLLAGCKQIDSTAVAAVAGATFTLIDIPGHELNPIFVGHFTEASFDAIVTGAVVTVVMVGFVHADDPNIAAPSAGTAIVTAAAIAVGVDITSFRSIDLEPYSHVAFYQHSGTVDAANTVRMLGNFK